ncbi:MAG TPA: ABC transporter permease [Vicinamibacterales bacterium]|jgi:predicted permease|nr:ABC transporter permease [Vicinamibacterales bacterium]
METLFQDIRFALRTFRRAPAFPLAAIATLALGIGATTAIFSTLNAVLLKPLPYPHAEDLYNIRTMLTDGRVTTGMLSNGEVAPLNAGLSTISRAAGMQAADLTLIHPDGTPQHVKIYGVTEGFFDLFGLPMTLGGFTHDNFLPPPPRQANAPQPAAPGPLPVVVISYRVWQDLFNADPAIVGKPIRFAEIATTIAGVAPRDFDTPHGGDFWFSQQLDKDDINHFFDGYMRLKPGVTLERANAEMAPIMERLGQQFPAADRNRAYVTKPLVASVVGDLGPILVIVMSATGLLLLLACVNVTNLLLARGAARAREMAVRVAIGAPRGRIVRQLLTESVVLATAGAVLGVALAYAGVRALLSLGASKLPRLDGVSFDLRVALFALVALVVSGILVGFAPALRLARTDVRALMNESTRSTTGGRGTARWLSVMTVVEIALAIMLVAGAGWLVRGFANLRSVDLGFVPEKRLIFDVSFLGPKYPNQDAVRTASQTLKDRLAALQGVTAVGSTSNFPLLNTTEASLIAQLHGEPLDPVHPIGVRQRIVGQGYFAAAGTRLVEGRDFGPDDRPNTRQVAIVNRAFVTRYLNGRDPLGLQFSAGYPAPDPRNEVTVVGVVDDVRQKTVSDTPEPAFYTPLDQFPLRRQTMVVSTSLNDVTALQSAIRSEIRQFDPQIAVEIQQVTEVVAGTLRRQQLGMTLMLIFGGVAILLAAVGIYGVVAYAVSQRRGEMATRLALGATPGSVFRLVMQHGALLALAGTLIGLVVAYLSGRVVASQIYAIRASDPLMLTAAIAIVAAIAAIATMIPAWRASRLAPSGVLHSE